ncbi:hypothetical protein BU14_0491s0005 [Porphyra umbilicalis]|uniref:Uncharacterized protein n=1 Tax=Porphyra umbilicalis TaxID=2786 RepID=A0A1X6NTJ4_PORUM|nr:hypothetical protein BU14_0491s0005 [Porphyra umbilicalis]|eukprot:OSX71897.1 hypothetical protein BU14_0491s0005 [Porphyra umbilicalis]
MRNITAEQTSLTTKRQAEQNPPRVYASAAQTPARQHHCHGRGGDTRVHAHNHNPPTRPHNDRAPAGLRRQHEPEHRQHRNPNPVVGVRANNLLLELLLELLIHPRHARRPRFRRPPGLRAARVGLGRVRHVHPIILPRLGRLPPRARADERHRLEGLPVNGRPRLGVGRRRPARPPPPPAEGLDGRVAPLLGFGRGGGGPPPPPPPPPRPCRRPCAPAGRGRRTRGRWRRDGGGRGTWAPQGTPAAMAATRKRRATPSLGGGGEGGRGGRDGKRRGVTTMGRDGKRRGMTTMGWWRWRRRSCVGNESGGEATAEPSSAKWGGGRGRPRVGTSSTSLRARPVPPPCGLQCSMPGHAMRAARGFCSRPTRHGGGRAAPRWGRVAV